MDMSQRKSTTSNTNSKNEDFLYTYENKKALIMSAFSIFYMPLRSLPDTEVLEYSAEHLVGRHFAAGDFGQMV